MAVTPLPFLDRTDPLFKSKVDTFFATELPTFSTEINNLAIDVQSDADVASAKALEAANSALASEASRLASENARDLSQAYADSAANSTAVSGAAPLWVSGTNYNLGFCVFSPINLETYRRKINGISTIDPSLDSDGWKKLGSDKIFQFYLATT